MYTFIEVLGSIIDSNTGPYEQAQLMRTLGEYCDARQKKITSKVTKWHYDNEMFKKKISPYLSHTKVIRTQQEKNLIRLKQEFHRMVGETEIPCEPFGNKLRIAIEKKQILEGYNSFKDILREAGLEHEHNLIKKWYSSEKRPPGPSDRNKNICTALEKTIGLKKGSLSGHVKGGTSRTKRIIKRRLVQLQLGRIGQRLGEQDIYGANFFYQFPGIAPNASSI